MQTVRTAAESMRLMARETRVEHGPVPRALGGHAVAPGFQVFADSQYLLRCASGYGYHYRPGKGIMVERPVQDADPDEEFLWLNGSVYAAVACLNGLYPLHASAVEHAGRVHAFTGPSGAGKSTLVSALGLKGLPLFCDDTLLLDLSAPGPVIALPGHKRLKLTEHALELTGLASEQPVGAETGKSYVAAPAGAIGQPLPLASLVMLEEGSEIGWEEIGGARRLLLLDDDHDVQRLYTGAQRPSRADLFAQRSRIASQVTMARLTRPLAGDSLAAATELALVQILQSGKSR
jgi:hypothetical protein